jgi:hypothetical protein
MRGSGRLVPVAALLSGILTAAAQGIAPDSVFPSTEPSLSSAISENTFGREQTNAPPRLVAARQGEPLAGNPLWAIPVSALPETGARPLFSPSRRPPPRPVVAALPPPPAKPTPPAKPEPDHPLLTLLGTIVGQSLEIGVFIDDTSQDVIRLRTGEVYGGWTLRSVRDRVTTFEKGGYREATLALPAPGAEPTPPSPGAASLATERVGIRGNDRMTGPSPVNTIVPRVVPAATKGGFKRTPRES